MKRGMRISRFAIYLLLALSLASSMLLADGLTTVCDVFGPSAGGYPVPTMLSSPATYTGVMYIALLVVLMVITILGMLYGIGYTFGINKLMSFVRNEMYESIASIFLVMFIIGGMAILFSLSSIITETAVATATSSGAGGIINAINSIPQNPQAMYTQICNQYLTRAALVIPFSLALTGTSALFSVLGTAYVYLEPNGVGVRFVGLLSGFFMSTQSAINIVNGIAMAIFILYLGTIGILFIIYWLFPIFLYLGIALRAFPWTRAAGGAFIGLFIAFYIVFPSLMYPFSYINIVASTTVSVSSQLLVLEAGSISNPISTVAGIFSGGLNILDFPNFVIDYGVSLVAPMLVDMLGILIAFVIAYDLLETLGDFFGAPSLQRGKLFSKLI